MHFFSILSLLGTAGAVLVPGPTGPYSVAMNVQSLTDTSRLDPLAPAGHRQHRRVMLSMFLPIETKHDLCSVSKVPYMTPATAADYGTLADSVGLPNDTFLAFEMQLCEPHQRGRHHRNNRPSSFPLAIFSPGYGESRLLYGALARSLASHGYAVLTVDHPYDANVVEFPDGTIIRGANLSDDTATLEKVVKIRAMDISFIIDQLHDASAVATLVSGFPGTIDLSKLIVFGHSLGGAAAAETMLSDSRVRGGINFDGMLVNPVKDAGLVKPFLLVGRPNHRLEDSTWDQFWAKLRGSKAELAISGTAHGSFTDLPLLVASLGLPNEAKKALQPLLGSIDSKRLDQVRNGALISFFDVVFKRQSTALRKIHSIFPEVAIVESDLPRTGCM